MVADGCLNKLSYTCEKSTFHFRHVAIIRRTEALASVEVSYIYIFFFAYALSRFSSKQPQQEQQKSK